MTERIDKILKRGERAEKIAGSAKIGMAAAIIVLFIEPYTAIAMEIISVVLLVYATNLLKRNIKELDQIHENR